MTTSETATPITIMCADGFRLGGHVWGKAPAACGVVVINAATGVLARYYHHYARFLAEHGFMVVTYDYRGIGASRPASLRRSAIRWRHWGERDFDAVLQWVAAHAPGSRLQVVGHSIGGFLPGFAEHAPSIHRILTVGAQYAWWPDYAPGRRLRLVLKWHVAMPIVTALCGYFPGRRLGWLEDLPPGVAHEWSFRGPRMQRSSPRAERDGLVARFAAVRAPILAVAMHDDEFATPNAVRRGLGYYTGSAHLHVRLAPADLGFADVGHFGLFHTRHRDGFWRQSLIWLRTGINPWPDRVMAP